MTVPVALAEREPLPLRRRLPPFAAVAAARLLARARPARIRAVLEFVRRGAVPATEQQAQCARRAVISVSLRCAGQHCLQRSIASALLCRIRGTWPGWYIGVRTQPFVAHAWIQVGNRPIGEPYIDGHYRILMAVPPTRSEGAIG
uniref:lasso peptide biosynthesis B2 protein n=1 Tax=Pseudonocardia sp. CA-138482 TaxID=3240023 RepID=UPI003F490C7B